MKGNIVLAIAGGAIGAFVGATIWAAVTVYSNYQIGFMAIGVGALVGYLVRILGGGHTRTFGLVGATFAIMGCVFGNILSGIGFFAKENGLGLLDTYLNFDFGASGDILVAMFSPIDILFYAIAISAAFRYSKTPDMRETEKVSQATSCLR